MQLSNQQAVCLRKSYLFNKGRYSRTRQIVRGAFFFSLLLNINVVFGVLLMYYLYTVKFTYIWWAFYSLLTSFILPSALRRSVVRNFNFNFVKNFLFYIFNILIFWKSLFFKHVLILNAYFNLQFFKTQFKNLINHCAKTL